MSIPPNTLHKPITHFGTKGIEVIGSNGPGRSITRRRADSLERMRLAFPRRVAWPHTRRTINRLSLEKKLPQGSGRFDHRLAVQPRARLGDPERRAAPRVPGKRGVVAGEASAA